ncbi:MAG: A/G-specific adenine glycosylase [Deltaproteobacteria bacterium]|nr:A/G-specific adenine glycosylase [Deltaproteobacteria bacterium]
MSASVRKKLLRWYDRNKRPLPWRETKDPYAVWLSEIMLQQTLVPTVIPYYRKFLSHFPTLKSVAEAPLDDLLLLWQGLGYYNRIRQFHRAAQTVFENYGGVVPSTKEELIKLPGLGDYTAGAIASIAFGEPTPAVDGNVIRVLSRLFASKADPLKTEGKKFFHEAVERLIDPDRPGDFNQALMDLGATLCLPTQPACTLCPLNADCQAYREGKPELFPKKRRKTLYRKEKLVCLLYHKRGKLFLRQRQKNEIMAGLWEFPLIPANPLRNSRSSWRKQRESFWRSNFRSRRSHLQTQQSNSERLTKIAKTKGLPLLPVTHTIMNRRMTIHPFVAPAGRGLKGKWIAPSDMGALPLTTITRKILKHSLASKLFTNPVRMI